LSNDYLVQAEETIDSQNEELVNNYYNQGYLFGRVSAGYVYQTRSLRIVLNKFELNSENRRILSKLPLEFSSVTLPIAEEQSWPLQKMIKDFYQTKFAVKFSAFKASEILKGGLNFNNLEQFNSQLIKGNTIVYRNQIMKHYAYPFYELDGQDTNNLGMAMMLTSILEAKDAGLQYFYLGGATRPQDKYKLQFSGLEWWNETHWESDLETLKNILQQN
jgi:arginyl-tRNA--protein-N-Asp/Glu arginylyltransferase